MSTTATDGDTQPTGFPEAPQTDAENTISADANLRDILIAMALAAGCELFVNSKKQSFVTVLIDGCKANWNLNSEDFKRYLHKTYRDTTKAVASSAVTDAIHTLDAMAAYSKNVHDVHIRVAHHDGNIYVDLADDTWRAICISGGDWKIIDNPPVRFVRKEGMLPLPTAVADGVAADKIKLLRPLINAPEEKTWTLAVAWILSAYSEGPYPTLVVMGEPGSAKSSLCGVLRQIIDPSVAPAVTNPKDNRDVIMAAVNSHVQCLSNLSAVRRDLSDLLCDLSTGVAHRERKYHTNDGSEQLFQAKRPVAINGVGLHLRSDLASRAVVLTLPALSDSERLTENELYPRLTIAAPEILGGIFDVLSSILANLPTTKLDNKPRMADFAVWATAAEMALGWKPGKFMNYYGDNQDETIEMVIEGDSFGTAICNFMAERQEWTGTWQELLNTVSNGTPQPKWPQTGKAVTTKLNYLANGLRHFGIHWKPKRTNKIRARYFFWNTQQGGCAPAEEQTNQSESSDLSNQQTIDLDFEEGEA